MDDSIPTENTIVIDGEVNINDYKIYWRDAIYRDLPNTLIFWGTFAGGALLLALILRNDDLGFSPLIFPAIIASIPILMTIFSYQQYMNAIKKYIAALSEKEKHYNLIINPDGKGIECLMGDNYSFLAWDSIRNPVEYQRYFALEFKTTPFLIMKNEFKDQADLKVFRNLLADKFGSRAKLLR